MTDMEILQIADQCGVVAVTKHEWDGKQFNHTDDYLDGDGAALVIFAKLVAQHEREVVANWIMDRGFATGHGDSIVDLLDQLEWQIAEKEREVDYKAAYYSLLEKYDKLAAECDAKDATLERQCPSTLNGRSI